MDVRLTGRGFGYHSGAGSSPKKIFVFLYSAGTVQPVLATKSPLSGIRPANGLTFIDFFDLLFLILRLEFGIIGYFSQNNQL